MRERHLPEEKRHTPVAALEEPTKEKGRRTSSQCPSGRGENNPAWDFQFIVWRFEVGKPHFFRTSLDRCRPHGASGSSAVRAA